MRKHLQSCKILVQSATAPRGLEGLPDSFVSLLRAGRQVLMFSGTDIG